MGDDAADTPGEDSAPPAVEPAPRPARDVIVSDGTLPPEESLPPAPEPDRVLPPPDAQVPYTLRVLGGWAWRLIAVAAALWVLAQIAGALTFILVALFVGAVISALVLPLVDLLDRLLPRAAAVAISLLVAVALVGFVLTFITIAFINQVPELSAQIVSGFESIRAALRNSSLQIDATQIDQYLQTAQDWLRNNAGNLVSGVIGGLGTVGQVLTGTALAVFAAVFFLYDGSGIWTWLVGTTPRRAHIRVYTSGVLAWRTFCAYARGTVFIALTNAILVGIGLTILRVPLPIPLALLVFFGTFIPYVGAPIAMFIAALIGLAANGIWSFVAVIVMITIIGQLEGNVLQPLIMSKQVALHPLVVILSVTAGGVAAGIVGAIVAVPVVSVVWVVIRYLTGRDPDNPRPPAFSGDPGHRVAGEPR